MDIAVPYWQKDEAKALGARWDGRRKTWYIPPGVDINKFAQWNPEIGKWNEVANSKGQYPNVSNRKPGKISNAPCNTGSVAAARNLASLSTTCSQCMNTPPWEPQCSVCAEEFARRSKDVRRDVEPHAGCYATRQTCQSATSEFVTPTSARTGSELPAANGSNAAIADGTRRPVNWSLRSTSRRSVSPWNFPVSGHWRGDRRCGAQRAVAAIGQSISSSSPTNRDARRLDR